MSWTGIGGQGEGRPTCAVDDVESFALDGSVRAERHVEAAALRDYAVR